MDTITESGMAIGSSTRRRNRDYSQVYDYYRSRVDEVLRVKRSESVMIEQPYTVGQDMKVTDVRSLMTNYGVSELLVGVMITN